MIVRSKGQGQACLNMFGKRGINVLQTSLVRCKGSVNSNINPTGLLSVFFLVIDDGHIHILYECFGR